MKYRSMAGEANRNIVILKIVQSEIWFIVCKNNIHSKNGRHAKQQMFTS